MIQACGNGERRSGPWVGHLGRPSRMGELHEARSLASVRLEQLEQLTFGIRIRLDKVLKVLGPSRLAILGDGLIERLLVGRSSRGRHDGANERQALRSKLVEDGGSQLGERY